MAERPAQSIFSDNEWLEWAHRAGPLFKWAGGKQRFLWDNQHLIPEFTGDYYEPFAGGLSVFFFVARQRSTPLTGHLSDANLRLVRAYQQVKRDWRSVNDQLRQLEAAYRSAEDRGRMYFDVRTAHNAASPAPDAARFIFLMRAGWNGVYRVNQRGGFNVPHGQLKDDLGFPSAEDLRAVSVALSASDLRANSWESTLTSAREGDFVFLDPPYFSGSRSQLYEPGREFTYLNHVRLADYLVDLKKREVDFLLTNAAHPAMIKLYEERGLELRAINMRRSISSRAEDRGDQLELVVLPGKRLKNTRAEAALDLQMRVKRGKINGDKNLQE
ncbi:DNA adenine methylase [Rathayibacter sp. Leaf299]|uniref:DNA adenine methylase n=1 Tax=Rathayibacter sp. Leaf299 TaxID=1736328 RepID=UPI0009E6AE3C|nr:Dam family site-specific DNA-(adenine-N6)-methyltransferase [Rathayibacter sp. Leaf299]